MKVSFVLTGLVSNTGSNVAKGLNVPDRCCRSPLPITEN